MYRAAGTQDRQFRDLFTQNSELKKLHEYLKKEVQIILNRHGIVQSRGTPEDPSGVGKRAGRPKFSRSVDSGSITSLKKQWSSLKQIVESLEARGMQADAGHVISVTDHEKELTRMREEIQELREELDKSRELIASQQQLLQEQILPQSGEAPPSPLWDAYFLEEQLRLQQDREAFEEQRVAFQEERDKFTEAAIRLGRERLQFKSDQALFVKQQFLNMTPGLGTPPWKKTPPWSALKGMTAGDHMMHYSSRTQMAAFMRKQQIILGPALPSPTQNAPDSPVRSLLHPKVHFTPYPHGAGTSQGKEPATNDNMTPSTAELYRVLKLAPPSRSALASEIIGTSHRKEDTKSEDTQTWGDSLSASTMDSDAPPQSVPPQKLSMTPYLCPRSTPMSGPRDGGDSKAPNTANVLKKGRLSDALHSPSSVKRGPSNIEKMFLLNHLHNMDQVSEMPPSVCRPENQNCYCCKYSSHDTRSGYEEDYLHSRDPRILNLQNPDPPCGEQVGRANSNILMRDSLCRTCSIGESDILHAQRSPAPVDPHTCKNGDSSNPYVIDQGHRIRAGRANTQVPFMTFNKQSGDSLHPTNSHRSCSDALHITDQCKSQSREALYATESRRRSLETHHPTDSSRRRSKDAHQGTDCSQRRPRESIYLTDSCRTLLKEALHVTENRRRSMDALHPAECHRSPRKSLHPDECHRSLSRESTHPIDCQERSSLHRRLSSHHRDSLYTTGPGRSPLHFRRSCPSAWTPTSTPNYICADLLSQFLDCSS